MARLKSTLSRRFLRFARFRQRPVQTPGGYQWQTDPAFALVHHIQRIALPRGAGDVELEALVSKLLSTPLDPAHPLWQFHLVANYQGGSALILRIHHCYADGIALIRVLLSMTDADRSGRAAGAGAAAVAARGGCRRRSIGGTARRAPGGLRRW